MVFLLVNRTPIVSPCYGFHCEGVLGHIKPRHVQGCFFWPHSTLVPVAHTVACHAPPSMSPGQASAQDSQQCADGL